ncbi:MAG: hypothetical protein U0Q12_00650 [Vicinamibacterales bacterium]
MSPVASESMHAFDAATKAGQAPFKVKDLAEAEFGRRSVSPSTRCRA